MLIYSTGGRAHWQSGTLDTETMTFHPEQGGLLDCGSYYAPKTQLDEAGNRVLWGWITETRPLAEYKAAGWAGMMSLPRVLSLTAHGRLQFRVASEVKQLRGPEQSLDTASAGNRILAQLDSFRVADCCGEILCTAKQRSQPFELAISGSAEGASPWLTIAYHPDHRNQIFIDARPIPLSLKEASGLEFHIYADSSVIELLANCEVAFTKRFYYSGQRPQDLRLRWTGSVAAIAKLSVWQLRPISNDRLTT